MDSSNRPGISGDISRLKTNGAATAEEMRDFLKRLKGKSPQEVLGTVAQSSLIQSVITAACGFAALIVAFTVVPFVWGKMAPAEKKGAAKPQAAAKVEPAQNASTANPVATGAPVAGDPGAGSAKPASAEKTSKADEDLLDKLGVGETKLSDPNKNPLDRKDDLLKEIK